MSLIKLDVYNVRNIETAALAVSPRVNLIIGPNGSGKTSLIEAVYLLGRARSFRTSRIGQTIRFGQEQLTVAGRIDQGDRSAPLTVGVRIARSQREIVLAGRKLTSSAELIRAFPVLLIHPASHALLEQSPKVRRQFLDWGAFFLDQNYLSHWRSYVRALSQRNALLRQGDRRNLQTWTHELARYGTIVAQTRFAYLERLRPYFLDVARVFLGAHVFSVIPNAGWNSDTTSLLATLEENLGQDLTLGFTQPGPHRADFAVMADGKPARQFLSRGQMKLLVMALMLAQARCLAESLSVRGCVLIDDLASELDDDNRARLLRFLEAVPSQVFISTTDDRIRHELGTAEAALFRIAGGRIERA